MVIWSPYYMIKLACLAKSTLASVDFEKYAGHMALARQLRQEGADAQMLLKIEKLVSNV